MTDEPDPGPAADQPDDESDGPAPRPPAAVRSGRERMADRRSPLRLVLVTAVLLSAALGSLTALGRGPFALHSSPSAAWVSPSGYTEQPDNPMPPRTLHRMVPDQFDAVTNLKHLDGTQIGNLVVRGDRLDMSVGSTTVWSGAYRSVPGFTGRLTLPTLATLVARSPHPGWLRPTGPGTYLLSAGLVQAPGSALEITAPEVTELRLAFQPHVYVAGVGASALFRGVRVTSWDAPRNGPATDAGKKRPFVSYDDGGRLDIVDSEFAYLGTDASKAYGITWGTGTTGTSINSVFHHNLFGTYTGGAIGVTFRKNVYRHNARYGLDPHTNSTGLVVVDNEAYGNNTHGIIFSDNVNHSVVENNRSWDNGVNGIMMDERSDHNLIRNNHVWNNRGGGIVLQGSSHNVVERNVVTGNKLGIRVNANTLGQTVGSLIAHNDLRGNRNGIQVYGGARDTVTTGNTITDTADQALNFIDPATSQSDTVTGAHKALVIDRAATVRNLTTTDVGRGMVIGEDARVTVEASRLTGRDIAVEVGARSRLNVLGTDTGSPVTISAARKAVVSEGAIELRNVDITDVDRGLMVGPDGQAAVTSARIVTANKGVEVEGFNGQGRVQLTASDIRAPQPVVGSTLWRESGNELSAIPSWLAVAGALFVLLAGLLHVAHRVLVPTAHAGRARPAPTGSDA